MLTDHQKRLRGNSLDRAIEAQERAVSARVSVESPAKVREAQRELLDLLMLRSDLAEAIGNQSDDLERISALRRRVAL